MFQQSLIPEWIFYSLIVIGIYAIWELLWEYITRKHDVCWCTSLITIISAGAISIIILLYHLNTHEHTFGKGMTNWTWFWLIFMAVFMVGANTFYGLAVKYGVNASLVQGLTNNYILVVFIASTLLYQQGWDWSQFVGLVMIVIGTYLITQT